MRYAICDFAEAGRGAISLFEGETNAIFRPEEMLRYCSPPHYTAVGWKVMIRTGEGFVRLQLPHIRKNYGCEQAYIGRRRTN